MTTSSQRRLIQAAAAVAVAVVVVWVYGAFDPSVNRFFPRCMFKVITGWDCPGCGSQRALHAILTWRWADAWRFNAALIPSLAIAGLVVITRIFPRRLAPLARFLGSRAFILALFFAYILWTVARNVIHNS